MKLIRNYPALLLATMLSLFAVHSYADDAAAANLPEPAAPQHATLNDGRVEVYIGTPRVSDYQIGDSIPVRVVFVLEPDAMYKARTAKGATDTTPSVVPTTAVVSGDKAMPVPPTLLDMRVCSFMCAIHTAFHSSPFDLWSVITETPLCEPNVASGMFVL